MYHGMRADLATSPNPYSLLNDGAWANNDVIGQLGR
jgi:hypothetical protein